MWYEGRGRGRRVGNWVEGMGKGPEGEWKLDLGIIGGNV